LEYQRTKEHREQNPKDEKGEDWPELLEPEKTQEEISETRNNLTTSKGDLESKLAEMLTDALEIKMPPALKDEKKLNVILIGPESCGRSTAANFLAQEHQRSLIRID
jgi:polynucleotide 5'-kinase involved in rRNA processing